MDKNSEEQIRWIFDIFYKFPLKSAVGCKAILTSTDNISFYGEIWKIIPKQERIQRGFNGVAQIPLLARIISFHGDFGENLELPRFCLELSKMNPPLQNPASIPAKLSWNPHLICSTENFTFHD